MPATATAIPPLKVCVLGGGSTYTPELMSGLLRRHAGLPVGFVHLYDIDADRLRTVGGFCARMAGASGTGLRLDWGTDLGAALEGASFVVLQLRVGGQPARLRDERLGMDAGLIGQETTGVGGLSCALRTLPVVLELARHIEQRAPDAHVINFTNPAGLVTEALLRHTSLDAIGLCNVPWNMRVEVARLLGAALEAVELDSVGLNHLSWVRGVRVGGVDRTDEMLRRFRSARRDLDATEPVVPDEVVADLGAVPSYYLCYYYETEAMLRHQREQGPRAARVMDVERALLDRLGAPTLVEVPPELALRGGACYSEAAAALMQDLWSDAGTMHVVNVRNCGAIPGFPDDVVVEVPARVGRSGAHAEPVAPLRPELDSLMRTVKSCELLTIAAAVEGDARLARLALLSHPLGPDASRVHALWQRLLRDHAGSLGRLDE